MFSKLKFPEIATWSARVLNRDFDRIRIRAALVVGHPQQERQNRVDADERRDEIRCHAGAMIQRDSRSGGLRPFPRERAVVVRALNADSNARSLRRSRSGRAGVGLRRHVDAFSILDGCLDRVGAAFARAPQANCWSRTVGRRPRTPPVVFRPTMAPTPSQSVAFVHSPRYGRRRAGPDDHAARPRC
jgi:hypothetical protein